MRFEELMNIKDKCYRTPRETALNQHDAVYYAERLMQRLIQQELIVDVNGDWFEPLAKAITQWFMKEMTCKNKPVAP